MWCSFSGRGNGYLPRPNSKVQEEAFPVITLIDNLGLKPNFYVTLIITKTVDGPSNGAGGSCFTLVHYNLVWASWALFSRCVGVFNPASLV